MVDLARALRDVGPSYEIPEDDLVGEVLVPAMAAAQTVQVGVGFFTSASLAQIGPGLAEHLQRPDVEPIRLLVSPELKQEDRDAITRGLDDAEHVVESALRELFVGAVLDTASVAAHAVDCLSYLVADNRLELRVCLMHSGMYHKKIWLFTDGDCKLAVHGSGNVTAPGLLVNGEQMTIDRAWVDGPSSQRRVNKLFETWHQQWSNEHPHSLTLNAPQAISFLRDYAAGTSYKLPSINDFWRSWRHDYSNGLAPELPPSTQNPGIGPQLVIPPDLEWREGRYRHQGRAVDSFLAQSSHRGIFAIATGGGKTKSSLIAATKVQNEQEGPFLLVVSVPSRPLLDQWVGEVKDFGIQPFAPSKSTVASRRDYYVRIQAALATEKPWTEVLVVTNKALVGDVDLRRFLDAVPAHVSTLLVADEVHNLGTRAFIEDPPDRFDARLGLSATPVRQYDPDGTHRLIDYFGPQLFDFDLENAIEVGALVPYSYHIHEVHLSDDEFELYQELTKKISALGYRAEDSGASIVDDSALKQLLFRRRAVLEQCSAKMDTLGELLEQDTDSVQRTLIYTSGKAPAFPSARRQIEDVNDLLMRLKILSHQVTGDETGTTAARRIIELFGEGQYQALTAMKVLDEGVDIPGTDTAYLLASSTVRREWIQRRGRILRSAPGKASAKLHDFLVIPPDISGAGAQILRAEAERVEEFARLSTNEWARDGARRVLAQYN